MSRRVARGPRAAAIAAVAALVGAVPAVALGTWCDLPFKEVAPSASAIVLARFDAAGETNRLSVVEIIRGELDSDVVRLLDGELRGYRTRDGQLFVVALDPAGRPLRALDATGYCEPVSILPIHRGAVRPKFRPDYDGLRRALPLEQLRAELVAAAGSGDGAR